MNKYKIEKPPKNAPDEFLVKLWKKRRKKKSPSATPKKQQILKSPRRDMYKHAMFKKSRRDM